MDRLPDSAAVNATIASQNPPSRKDDDGAPHQNTQDLSFVMKDTAVPFDEAKSYQLLLKSNKGASEITTETGCLEPPPDLKKTASALTVEMLFPAFDGTTSTPAASTTTTTTKPAEKNQKITKPKVSEEEQPKPNLFLARGKENTAESVTTTPNRYKKKNSHKKRKSWLSLSPSFRRSSKKDKDEQPLLQDTKEADAIHILGSSTTMPQAVKTGDFLNDTTSIMSTKKGDVHDMVDQIENTAKDNVDDETNKSLEKVSTEVKASSVVVNHDNNLDDYLATVASDTANEIKDTMKTTVPPVLSTVVDKLEKSNSLVQDTATKDVQWQPTAAFAKEITVFDSNQNLRNVTLDQNINKFPSVYDIANTVVSDIEPFKTMEEDVAASTIKTISSSTTKTTTTTPTTTSETAVTTSSKRSVTASAPDTAISRTNDDAGKSLVTVAEGIDDVKAAEKRNYTRSISAEEDDYDVISLADSLFEREQVDLTHCFDENDDDEDPTEKMENLSDERFDNMKSKKEMEEASASKAPTSSNGDKKKNKKKSWKQRLKKSLSPKRKNSADKLIPEPSFADKKSSGELKTNDKSSPFAGQEASEAQVTEEIAEKFSEEYSAKLLVKPKIDTSEAHTKFSKQREEIIARSKTRDADRRVGRSLIVAQLLLGVMFTVYFFSMTHTATIIRNHACAPVAFGAVLPTYDQTHVHAVYDAPWWLPASLNSDQVFNVLCGEKRPHTKVEWVFERETKSDVLYRLVISEGSSIDSTTDVLVRKKLVAASFCNNEIILKKKNGKEEVIPAPWWL